jgi:hypothetical protein
MKKSFILAMLCFVVSLLSAFPARIDSWNIDQDLKILSQLKISVDNVSRSNGSIIVYLRDEMEFTRLLDHGFRIEKLPDLARQNALELHQDRSLYPSRDAYYTITQYQQFMQDTADQYSNICQLHQIGTSVQGRPLYFLKITDNPQLDEAEPEFLYISSIHGDEPVGYDMCIRLIKLLTEDYGNDPRITNLVDNTEIWICPMFNPDGYVLGQRYNAQGIDLNRNFPMPFGINQHPDGYAWAPENIAMMDFLQGRNFVLSANFHGGALVANYPWDYSHSLTPDNDLLIQAALTYASNNSAMYNNSEFSQGITNGADWYVITGSLQDWTYGYTDGMDITMEIGNNKWPSASQLPTFWNQNRESMLSYMEFVHRGLHGTVHSEEGAPLVAEISILDNYKLVHTDSNAGDYHRMLLPGSYEVTASAPGYLPRTETLTIPASGSLEHDFVLSQAQVTNLFAQVRDSEGNPIPGLNINLNTQPPTNATLDAQGCFEIHDIFEGQYELSVKAGTETLFSKDFLLVQNDNRLVFIYLEPEVAFQDACEDITNWVASGPWGAVTYQGLPAITDSPSGNYGNNVTRTLHTANPISLQNMAEPTLSFNAAWDLEEGYDFVHVQASTSTSNWLTLHSFTGTNLQWQPFSFTLEQFAGESIYLRFVLQSDWYVNADGIYLNEITVSGIDSDLIVHGDVDGNRIVNSQDANIILQHCVDFDPIPEIDPIPWSPQRFAAADVDLNDSLDSMDAFLVHKYLRDPLFRFPAQGGEELQLPEVTLTVEHETQGDYEVTVIKGIPEESIYCIDWQLLPTLSFPFLEISVNGLEDDFMVYNSYAQKFAWAGSAEAKGPVFNIVYLAPPQEIELHYTVNGHPGMLNLPSGSAIQEEVEPVAVFELMQNHPNPFNPDTRISFSLPAEQNACLMIYNSRGQKVKTLADGVFPRGQTTLVWDGRDDLGKPLSSGIYFYTLQSGAESQKRKMILLK